MTVFTRRRLHIDIETKSRVDLSGAGLAPYARDAEVLLVAYAFDDEPVQLWDVTDGSPMPEDLASGLVDPEFHCWAWNARFEYELLSACFPQLKLVESQWRDSMLFAAVIAMPMHLGGAGAAVNLDDEFLKMGEGKTLIKKFCVPRQPTASKPWEFCDASTDPDDWRRFRMYCVRDVESERAIWHKLSAFNLCDWEWNYLLLDWKINRRGMPVDVEYAKAAIKMDEEEKIRLRAALNRLTGLENGNSVAQLMPWLKARGYDRDSLDKDSVKLFVRQNPEAEPKVMQALRLRAQISSTSVSKYKAVLALAQEADGWHWVPNTFQFRGAGRTGRYAGRQPQWQNAARPKWSDTSELVQLIKAGDHEDLEWIYGPVTSCLSGGFRSIVRAPAGQTLHIVDFSAIEVWVAEWLTGCKALRLVLEQGKDPYRAFGEHFLNKAHDDISKDERTLMKPVVLGGGYGLGGGEEKEDGSRTGLMAYGASMGVMLDKETAHRQIEVYREVHPEIVEYWYDLERAFIDAVANVKFKPVKVGKVEVHRIPQAVRIKLPSGRFLNYYEPELREMRMPWLDRNGDPVYKVVPTYRQLNQLTKKVERMATRGAKLFENVDQAVAADVLVAAMTRLDDRGFTIVGHIHDEVICCEDEDDSDLTLHLMEQIMVQPIKWAPGLHLAAEGGSAQRWRKF